MKAMVLNRAGTPLEWTELPDRAPGPGEVGVKVLACGVCRTDLHVVDGELPDPKSPIIPGHEIVGQFAIDNVQIRAANPAGEHLYPDLAGAGRTIGQFGPFKRCSRAVQYHCLHGRILLARVFWLALDGRRFAIVQTRIPTITG